MKDYQDFDNEKQGGDGILKVVLFMLVGIVCLCFLFGTEKGQSFLNQFTEGTAKEKLDATIRTLPDMIDELRESVGDLYRNTMAEEDEAGAVSEGEDSDAQGIVTDVTADGTPVYDALYTALSAYETSVTLQFDVPAVDMDHLSEIYRQMLADHPEMFWLTGGMAWNGVCYINRSTYTLTPMLEEGTDMSLVPQMQAEMDAEIQAIVDDAMQQDSVYNRALRAHDILARTCDYNEEAAARIEADIHTTNTQFAVSAYGALVNHSAVCSGYSKAYQLILNRMGIPCGYVSGQATNEQGTVNHAWNSVEIDGVTLYVDVTWDDPIGGDEYYISRQYFCLSREEIMQDHTFETE